VQPEERVCTRGTSQRAPKICPCPSHVNGNPCFELSHGPKVPSSLNLPRLPAILPTGLRTFSSTS
jgi:hypothetical protein